MELFEFFKPTVPGLDDVAQFSVDSVVASHPSPSTECNRVVCIDVCIMVAMCIIFQLKFKHCNELATYILVIMTKNKLCYGTYI